MSLARMPGGYALKADATPLSEKRLIAASLAWGWRLRATREMLRPENCRGFHRHASSYVCGCVAACLARTARPRPGAQKARRLYLQRQHAERPGVRRLQGRDRH